VKSQSGTPEEKAKLWESFLLLRSGHNPLLRNVNIKIHTNVSSIKRRTQTEGVRSGVLRGGSDRGWKNSVVRSLLQ
jgi:hypothetical protein